MKYGRNSDTPALLRALPSQPNVDTLGARLRDHVRPGLPYPFPPIRALCDVSPSLLFSSLPLGKPVQLSWNLELVYTAPAGKSTVQYAQKTERNVGESRKKERKRRDSRGKHPNFVKKKTRQAALWGQPAKMPLLSRRTAAQKSSLRSPKALHSKAFGAFVPTRGGRLPPRAPPPRYSPILFNRGFSTRFGRPPSQGGLPEDEIWVTCSCSSFCGGCG